MDEKVSEESAVPEGVTVKMFGWYSFESKAGYLAFIRAGFYMSLSDDLMRRLGKDTSPGSGGSQNRRSRIGGKQSISLQGMADGFCESLLFKLYDEGFHVHWEFRGKGILKDGKELGPGTAVFLEKGDDTRKAAPLPPDESLREAKVFANSLKYYAVLEGKKILVPALIDDLMCGIVSGGPMYQACIEDPEGQEGRLLHEHLYERVLVNDLVNDIAKIKESMRSMPPIGGRDIDWENEIAELMRLLIRRRKMLEVKDDAGIWEKMEEEIGMGCPAFRRLPLQKRWEIFRRIRVSLGLVDDE